MGEKILAVKQTLINRLSIPLGLIHLSPDVVSRYLKDMEREICVEDRDFLEGNPDYRQLIPYPIIRYKDKVFAAVRTPKGAEDRLHNLMSVGFGGHARPIDIGSNKLNLIEQLKLNTQRELDEELFINSVSVIQFDGFINDLSDNVGRDHLGILVYVTVDKPNVGIKEKSGFVRGNFYTKEDLLKENLENWSYLVITNI